MRKNAPRLLATPRHGHKMYHAEARRHEAAIYLRATTRRHIFSFDYLMHDLIFRH